MVYAHIVYAKEAGILVIEMILMRKNMRRAADAKYVNLVRYQARLWSTTRFWPIIGNIQSNAIADNSDRSDWLVERSGQFFAAHTRQTQVDHILQRRTVKKRKVLQARRSLPALAFDQSHHSKCVHVENYTPM